MFRPIDRKVELFKCPVAEMTRPTRLALITELCFPRITCRPNVGMWRYRRVEMLENGNVELLRCLIVEKWRSLVGI